MLSPAPGTRMPKGVIARCCRGGGAEGAAGAQHKCGHNVIRCHLHVRGSRTRASNPVLLVLFHLRPLRSRARPPSQSGSSSSNASPPALPACSTCQTGHHVDAHRAGQMPSCEKLLLGATLQKLLNLQNICHTCRLCSSRRRTPIRLACRVSCQDELPICARRSRPLARQHTLNTV